ncbi:MOSC domain-containing protein [Flavimarina sp. Hel_I_48]|uniref:MOSC domain-containing protein n=1 Tax=Flavimarina sp. Hel_I_48 TaxID=1392488 RepID=UPI0004DF77A8|nr:MOSC N-terminal beta barrel domain-containing protein [Flavimarina sp. Hel_I_48]
MKIEQLYVYPLKSARSITREEVEVVQTGFLRDREFAVINTEEQIITARENPALLNIKVALRGDLLELSADDQEPICIDYTKDFQNKVQIELFKIPTEGLLAEHPINKWLSHLLDQSCRLVMIDKQKPRFSSKSKSEIPINFCDASPIHLVTTASLENLNKRLKKQVKIGRFRPNIVVSGSKPFEEEFWKNIKIGNCIFEVVSCTKRCTMITIDPDTSQKDKDQQPLRELASYKKAEGGVDFGVYLVPKSTGTLKLSDAISVNS